MAKAEFQQALFISEITPSPIAWRLAIGVASLLSVMFIFLAPFVRSPLLTIPAFIPAYESSLAIVELLTAFLLFGQYARGAGFRLLVLGLGYLYNTLIIIVHQLSFPGAYRASGLIGGGTQTTAWLYVLWHFGFAVFAMVFARMKGRAEQSEVVDMKAAAMGISAVVLVVLLIAVMCTAGHAYLPKLIEAGNYAMMVEKGITPSIIALCIAVVIMLLRRQDISVLDLWLATVMVAWALDILMSAVLGSSRYDLGWYFGRLFGLAAGVFILGVLLWEGNTLYKNLALTIIEARQHEKIAEATRLDLIRAQRLEAVGQLTGGVAHDFNNVLQVISASLGMLKIMVKGNEIAEKLIGRSMVSIKRGARLSSELLSFARQQPLHPKVLDVSMLIEALSETFERTLGETVEVATELAPSLANILVDRALLENALLNLAINARDAMHGTGTITLGAINYTPDCVRLDAFREVPSGNFVRLYVKDSGVGISADVLAHVFEPFFTTKPVDQGTGLGLSMVHGFVKQSNGHIAIQSAPGEGTTVSIFLPVSTAPIERSVVAAQPQADATGSESILVVDDHPDVRALAVETLTRLGYRVEQAHDAKSALAKLEEHHHFDLLFSDVVMPGPVRTLDMVNRARELHPAIAVLFTSGYTNDLIENVGVSEGSPDLIAKPYEAFVLAAKVYELLHKQESRRRRTHPSRQQ
jgi:signal transduction histidine kinase/ActR/RegA family two-component response regulator